MKKVVLILALFISNLLAYEAGQLSLDTPNVLKSSEGSFSIRHRFYGKADDYNKFFGTDEGGNMYLTLKYALLDNLLVSVDHTKEKSTYGVGLEYSQDFSWIKAGLRVKGYRFERAFEEYSKSYMGNFSLQTMNIFDHLILTANVGYDNYYQYTFSGFGADINVDSFLPFLTFTEKISLLAEYYPQVEKIDNISGKHPSYAVGVKFQTYGHHFELMLSNSTSMEPRTMGLGTNSEDLHFGFNINRKF